MTERDWIHLGLSILGCIPVVGITANIANAVLYFQEGDALNGLLSVAGALIGVGGVTAAIGAAKGICALTTVGQAIKTAGVAYTAGASAMQTIEAASKTFNMLKENDFQWNEEILISAGQTALSLAGTIAGFKAVGSCINEAAALSASGLACFVAGTKVLTDKGFKNIEDIEEGDYVYSTSDETGESGYKEVLQVFQKETEVVTHVFYEVEQEDGETRTEEIETTLNHLFWCEGEWKAAGTLKPGDKLTLADGSQVEVTEITYEDRHTTVYNMEVEDYHTYHVGEDGVWVHNNGCGISEGMNTDFGDEVIVEPQRQADFIVTPKGTVMDTSKNYNLVGSGKQGDWFQIHNYGKAEPGFDFPHTHSPQMNTNGTYTSYSRIVSDTTAEDIDLVDELLRSGRMIIRKGKR